ncbi:hypothetical protein BHE90_002675 [Fusarium euwallaceae]|uniref:NAD(P)-binding protein n=1 Tax=Fusarium euwallaceae TaxID=1147111 RepID=A0A430M472_9HYPO|nr:hypothetical protein BHE90_002675 [Fusarium euwallaceae]
MASFGFHTTSDEASAALKENITSKTIVITGVSPGSLGADTARAILAQSPAKLILASQTESKLHEVIKSLDTPAGTSVYPLVLDLASHDAVRKAAAELSTYVDVIDTMICTAGVMALPSYRKSKDGIEMQFAVNYLGHFLFINLLVDKILAGDATVVTYTSEAHTRADLGFLDDLTYDEGTTYEKWNAYSNAKACDILLSVGKIFELWNGNLNSAIKVKTLAEGAATGIIAAFDHRLSNEQGYFLADGALTEQGLLPAAVDPVIAAKLRGISEKLVK